METADRPLPARISFLAGPPRRRHLHGRALAPPPPTSASAPPSSSSSLQPPHLAPPHHRATALSAVLRRPATRSTPPATPPPRLALGKTRSARRGPSWGRRQHPPPSTAGRGRHRRRRRRQGPGEEIRRLSCLGIWGPPEPHARGRQAPRHGYCDEPTHPVRRRLAAAAWSWNRATTTGHLGAGAVRQLCRTKAASDGNSAPGQEKAHSVPPLFSAMRADLTKYSTTPDLNEEQPEPESKPELEETPTFSWELQDLLNEDLYKDEMKRIPATCASIRDYTRSFMVPLMEERRAGVCAALQGIGHAPVARVVRIQEYSRLSVRSEYTVWFEPARWSSAGECYSPKDDDVVLLTHRRPTCLSDLEQPCAIAIVRGDAVTEGFKARAVVELLSGSLPVEQHGGRGEMVALPLFAVHLISHKTTKFTLDALSLPAAAHRDISLIEKTANYAPTVGQERNSLLPELPPQIPADKALDDILEKFKLNPSQHKAVLDCVSAMHQDTSCWVRLICGPPGTGKTKITVPMLWSMMMKNHRTLALARTKTTVLEVASRLLALLDGGSPFSLSDVVLLGSKDHNGVVDASLTEMFLEPRISRLEAVANWTDRLSDMVDLLEKPWSLYTSYLWEARTGHDEYDWKVQGLGQPKGSAYYEEQYTMSFKEFFVYKYENFEECLRSCIEAYR